MLRITAVALACLSLAVIQPMGVAGRLQGNTVGGVIARERSNYGASHGAARLSRRATSCQSGQYLNGSTCTNCNPGYYCTGGTAGQTACPAGTYNNQPSSSGSGSCQTVQCGYYPTGGNSDGTASTGQSACGSGYYSAAGSTSCTVCPAGNYCNASTTCSPTPCDPGTYAAGTGSAQQCQNCPAGTFNNSYGNTSCCQCCAGWYNSGNNNHTNCQQCPNKGNVQSSGVTSQPGSSNPSSCEVYNGSSGQSAPASTCSQSQPATKTPGTCPATTGMTPSAAVKRRTTLTCPYGQTRCEVMFGRGGWECVDTQKSLDTCGGCDGDCSTLEGTNEVGCAKGHCVIKSCAKGYKLVQRGDGTSRGGLEVGQHCVSVKVKQASARHALGML
ncbi:hypothetical protein BDV93DRAFT_548787 [Ceratobasidium sp. AG-I]|nr:hypothetical protein BDV93DRAFT_548787 [Ceratobasidium sp. AG-I]